VTDAPALGIRARVTNLVHSKSFAYAILCLVCSISLGYFLSFFQFLDEFAVDVWESPDNWYLGRYRPLSSGLWWWTRSITASAWNLSIPIAFLIVIGVLNRRLSRDHARNLDIAMAVAWVTACFLTAACLMNLMHFPLGML
jgi:hypothetical protein